MVACLAVVDMPARKAVVRSTSASERIVEEFELHIAQELQPYLESGSIEIYAISANRYIKDIVSDYIDGKLFVNPDMRREYTWNPYKASRFIESVYLQYPIPPIFAIEVSGGRFQVIDGFHRLETLRRYIQNEFRPRKIVSPLNNKYFKRLPEDVQSRFLSRVLSVFTVTIINKGGVPDDKFNELKLMLIYDIFRRINLGAKPLTFAQVVFCGVTTPTTKMIKEVASTPEYTKLVEPLRDSEKKNMLHLSVLLSLGVCFYKNKLINVLGTGRMKRVAELSDFLFKANEKQVKEVEDKLRKAIKLAVSIGLERKHFVPATYGLTTQQRISQPLFLLTLWTLSKLAEEKGEQYVEQKAEAIRKTIEKFYADLMRDPAKRELYVEISHTGDQEALVKLADELYAALKSA